MTQILKLIYLISNKKFNNKNYINVQKKEIKLINKEYCNKNIEFDFDIVQNTNNNFFKDKKRQADSSDLSLSKKSEGKIKKIELNKIIYQKINLYLSLLNY